LNYAISFFLSILDFSYYCKIRIARVMAISQDR